jgi:hypothetical protein
MASSIAQGISTAGPVTTQFSNGNPLVLVTGFWHTSTAYVLSPVVLWFGGVVLAALSIVVVQIITSWITVYVVIVVDLIDVPAAAVLVLLPCVSVAFVVVVAAIDSFVLLVVDNAEEEFASVTTFDTIGLHLNISFCDSTVFATPLTTTVSIAMGKPNSVSLQPLVETSVCPTFSSSHMVGIAADGYIPQITSFTENMVPVLFSLIDV